MAADQGESKVCNVGCMYKKGHAWLGTFSGDKVVSMAADQEYDRMVADQGDAVVRLQCNLGVVVLAGLGSWSCWLAGSCLLLLDFPGFSFGPFWGFFLGFIFLHSLFHSFFRYIDIKVFGPGGG